MLRFLALLWSRQSRGSSLASIIPAPSPSVTPCLLVCPSVRPPACAWQHAPGKSPTCTWQTLRAAHAILAATRTHSSFVSVGLPLYHWMTVPPVLLVDVALLPVQHPPSFPYPPLYIPSLARPSPGSSLPSPGLKFPSPLILYLCECRCRGVSSGMPSYCFQDCHYFYRTALRGLNISTHVSPLYA